MLAIEIKNLSKEYAVGFWKKKRRPALKSLNLTVEAGETFGFLGPNGAGKTTTLKLLMGSSSLAQDRLRSWARIFMILK